MLLRRWLSNLRARGLLLHRGLHGKLMVLVHCNDPRGKTSHGCGHLLNIVIVEVRMVNVLLQSLDSLGIDVVFIVAHKLG